MRNWNSLPVEMQCSEIEPYYNLLQKKRSSLFAKRCFDLVGSLVLIVLLSPLMLILIPWIRLDSPGPAIFCQQRITRYGKPFKIFKFRSMHTAQNTDCTSVTVNNDNRITKLGAFLRKYRLDELPQLFNIFLGDMSFVGTRPEVPEFVAEYSSEMRATLLLPAGVTSKASIEYKDESRLLSQADDAHSVYINQVLPAKMAINLQQLKEFSLKNEMLCILQTIKAVLS